VGSEAFMEVQTGRRPETHRRRPAIVRRPADRGPARTAIRL
jgi:hypothetical protein